MDLFYIADEISHCWEAFDGSIARPLWNASVYEYLREKYVDIVDEEEEQIGLEDAMNGGLLIPFEARHTPEKGRGLFAAADITKGTIMWNEEDHAIFKDEDEFDEFLDEIGYDLACDIIQWAYVEPCKIYDPKAAESCYHVGVELGPSSLINTVNDKKNEKPNFLNCPEMDDALRKEIIGCSTDMAYAAYATRDIKEGEEILTNYKAFDNDAELEWFDDKVWYAWFPDSLLGEEL